MGLQENERLYSEVQRTQKELKSLKDTWIEETQCLRAELVNERYVGTSVCVGGGEGGTLVRVAYLVVIIHLSLIL